MAVTSYLTLAGEQSSEIEVLKSRFRCTLRRVADERTARAALDQQRREFSDAGHHCHAFLLGPDGQQAHSSDDGEPSGTAGSPIMEQLRGRGLSDVMAVVTRWFGGSLLGTGRLSRAYAEATRSALDQAQFVRRELQLNCCLGVEVAAVGRLEHIVRGLELGPVEVDYQPSHTHQARVLFSCPPAALPALESLLAEHTGGTVLVEQRGQSWADRPARRSEPTSTKRSNKNS